MVSYKVKSSELNSQVITSRGTKDPS